MRKVYLERRDFFVAQFNEPFGDPFILRIPQAGLHFVAWLRRETNLATVARACAEIGFKLSQVSSLCIRANLKPAFAFASLPGGQHRFGRILLDSPPRSK